MDNILRKIWEFGEYVFGDFGDDYPIIANLILCAVLVFVVIPLAPFILAIGVLFSAVIEAHSPTTHSNIYK